MKLFKNNYECKLNNSIMTSIDPKLWGSHTWAFLYYVILGYSETPSSEDKKHMKNLMMTLPYILPCIKCKQGMQEDIAKIPLTDKELSNKDMLLEWLVKINNLTNDRTNTPHITVDKVKKKYLKIDKNYSTVSNAIIIFIILIFMYIYYKYVR